MKSCPIVVIGASAGGVEALTRLVGGLPSDLEGSVCIVLHTPSGGSSNLPTILDRAGPLSVEHARDGVALTAGRILVAPPDHQMTVVGDHVRVARGPRENGHRPAIDPLFRSAARAAGARAIGVILSGTLDDGSAGLEAIASAGGTTVIQHPDDALFPGMPLSAAERVTVDHSGPASELGHLISELVAIAAEKGGPSVPTQRTTRMDADEPARADTADMYLDPPGKPSHYSCPDCGGVLWRSDTPLEADLRCRVGHAYSYRAMERAQRDGVEAAMWIALRALEENALTARRLAEDSRTAGRGSAARRFSSRQAHAERQAALIREALVVGDGESIPAA